MTIDFRDIRPMGVRLHNFGDKRTFKLSKVNPYLIPNSLEYDEILPLSPTHQAKVWFEKTNKGWKAYTDSEDTLEIKIILMN